ncbi:uncharacterized protein LOC143291774 [Babylonia areolata]|uniref:uncharacterized protein LOC143291774 n=1 Tax=Babylonia areolata TaxID=304850 RepID=UPI003FD49D26
MEEVFVVTQRHMLLRKFRSARNAICFSLGLLTSLTQQEIYPDRTMAGKMPPSYPYPGGQGQPPPYQQYPGTSTTVVVQGAPQTTVVHQKPSRGFFGSLMKDLNSVGNQIGKEIDYLGNKINDAVDTNASNPLLAMLQTGNVVQLVSRASGRALQILMGPSGQLMVDGNGPVGPGAFNTAWTVVNEGMNQVRLHNNNNYLTVVGGHTTLVNMPPGSMHGVDTKWQVSVMQNFLVLESLKERGRHMGILHNGQLKPALACGREQHAQFGLQLLSSPYPQGATAQVTVVKK